MEFEDCTFLSACSVNSEALWFAVEIDEMAEKSGSNSSFVAMRKSKWMKAEKSGGWAAISMATAKPQGGIRTVLAIGSQGEYWELEPLSTDERIGRIKNVRYAVRSTRSISDSLYLCGMGRTVMVRRGTGKWDDISPNAATPPDQILGFEDLDGFSKEEIYAVGWQGEIWWYDNGRWRQIDSPVSANLNSIVCADDGIAYVVGDDGAMIRGRKDEWHVLHTGRGENLMDVAVYDQQVYTVTDFRILVLDGEKLVNAVNFADAKDRPATCLHLIAGSDTIFSVGTKDIFRLVNKAWERVA